MILAAARALAENSPARKDSSASLLPALADLRKVAVQIAIAVGLEGQKVGIAPTQVLTNYSSALKSLVFFSIQIHTGKCGDTSADPADELGE
jgi:malic enzyme